jgi:hypothetical protein
VVETETWRTRGIIDFQYKPKPSFVAFKVLIQKLDKATVFKNLNVRNNQKTTIFKEGNKFTGVFFTWEGEQTLTLRSLAKNIKVFDIYGKEKEVVPVKDGKFVLKVSPEPIYVEGDLRDLSLVE